MNKNSHYSLKFITLTCGLLFTGIFTLFIASSGVGIFSERVNAAQIDIMPTASGVTPKPDASFGNYYTFLPIPDTQYLAASGMDCLWGCGTYWRSGYNIYPPMLPNWILANKDTENIKAVLSMGDLQSCGSCNYQGGAVTQWTTAASLYNPLRNQIPIVSSTIGNHDYDSGDNITYAPYDLVTNLRTELTRYNAAFPYSLWSTQGAFGGGFQPGQMENVYYRYNINGIYYLVFSLEFFPRDEVLVWVDNIISLHPNDTTIITTHAYLRPVPLRLNGIQYGPVVNQNTAVDMWEKVLRNTKIF